MLPSNYLGPLNLLFGGAVVDHVWNEQMVIKAIEYP